MPSRASSPLPVDPLRFRQVPLLAAAVWFAGGIALASWQRTRDVEAPTVLLLGAMVLLFALALVALRWGRRVSWLPVAALWWTLGMAAPAWHPAATTKSTLAPFADNLSRAVEARVVRVRVPPQPASHADEDAVPPWELSEDSAEATGKAPSLSVDLLVDRVEEVTPDTTRMIPAAGGVRVSLFGPVPPRGCGDRVELPLRLKLPNRYRDPGAFDFGAQLAEQGIAARASAQGGRVRVLGRSPALARCRLQAAQGWASGRLLRYAGSAENRRLPALLRLSEPDARMLAAMLFGDRAGLTHSLRTGFERTGSFHLFVVSGMHIALLAGGVYWLFRRVRAPVWLATAGTLLLTAAYAALTGWGQPAQRALGMLAVFLLARLLGREHDRAPLNALGAAALAMLVWSPGSLFGASFAMTVLAIVAIAGIALPLGEWTFLRYVAVTRDVFRRHTLEPAEPRAAQLRLMLELWGEALASVLGRWSRRGPALLARWAMLALELALVGAVAEAVMALPMAVYFHRAAVYALPANLLVVPLVAVLAPLAVVLFCAALLSPVVAVVPGAATALLLHLMTAGIHGVSRLGGADLRVPAPSPWVIAAVLLGFALCCTLARRGRWPALAAAGLLPLLVGLVLWPEPPLLQPGRLELTAIDVGQGDSLLAVNPAGGTMLIDAGGPVGGTGGAEVVSNFDVGEEVVSPYLWSRRLRHVDVVVLTHAHTDHMGGMPAVLRNFRPRELWVGIDPHSALYGALLVEAARLGVVVRHVHAGGRMSWGPVEVRVLAPAPGYENPGAPKNDDSVVLRMQYGKASMLLEGDAERPSEEDMVAAGFAPVTLLKVGHHGSRTSSTEPFVRMAQPSWAVVSDGKGNTFGHPREEVLDRLHAAGARVFRTDEMGRVSFSLGADGSVAPVRTGDESPDSP